MLKSTSYRSPPRLCISSKRLSPSANVWYLASTFLNIGHYLWTLANLIIIDGIKMIFSCFHQLSYVRTTDRMQLPLYVQRTFFSPDGPFFISFLHPLNFYKRTNEKLQEPSACDSSFNNVLYSMASMTRPLSSQTFSSFHRSSLRGTCVLSAMVIYMGHASVFVTVKFFSYHCARANE